MVEMGFAAGQLPDCIAQAHPYRLQMTRFREAQESGVRKVGRQDYKQECTEVHRSWETECCLECTGALLKEECWMWMGCTGSTLELAQVPVAATDTKNSEKVLRIWNRNLRLGKLHIVQAKIASLSKNLKMLLIETRQELPGINSTWDWVMPKVPIIEHLTMGQKITEEFACRVVGLQVTTCLLV